MSRENIKFVYSNKVDYKYFLSQSDGSIFVDSTNCCSVIGGKKEFSILFFEK